MPCLHVHCHGGTKPCLAIESVHDVSQLLRVMPDQDLLDLLDSQISRSSSGGPTVPGCGGRLSGLFGFPGFQIPRFLPGVLKAVFFYKNAPWVFSIPPRLPGVLKAFVPGIK